MPHQRVKLLLLILMVAGFAGNYFSLSLFFGVNFLFGSIAVLLVLALFGLGWGTVAAIIANSYSYFLLNHPYAAIILICEAVFVGFLLRRQSKNLLVLDGIYWLLIGMPLVWLFYGGVLHVDAAQTSLMALKQSINGIFNAFIANLLITHLPIHKWGKSFVTDFDSLVSNFKLMELPLTQKFQESQRANGALEERVKERTTELLDANKQLNNEIGERQRAEETLRQNEERLARIFETIPDGITILNCEGEIISANAAAEKILRLTRSDLTERIYNDPAWKITTADGKPFSQDELPFVRVMRTGESVYGVEHAIEHPDKTRTILCINAAPLHDAAGKIVSVIAAFIDITERKLAEEALKKERNFISAILDTTGALVIVLDAQGRIVRFNRACEETTQFSFSEVQDKYFWDLFLIPEEVEPTKAVFKQLQGGKFPSQCENYWVAKDNSRRLIAWSNTAILDANGQLQYIIGSGIDITQRKQAEEALRKSEELYRTLASNLPNGAVILFDRDLRYTIADGAGLGAVGLSKELLEGKTIWESFPSETCETLEPIYGAALAGEASINEMTYSNHIYSVHTLPIRNASGEISGGMVMTQDITNLKQAEAEIRALNAQLEQRVIERTAQLEAANQLKDELLVREQLARAQAEASEQRFRFLAEVIPQLVWTAQPDGGLDYVNQRVLDYFACTSEEILRWGWHQMLHPEDQPKCLEYWSNSLETGKPYEIEFRIKRGSDGTYRWHLVRALPLRDLEGKIVSWFGTCTDIDDQKRAEDVLRQQAEALAQANRLKDEFLAIVSHELRTPLNSMMGWAKLLRSRKFDEATTDRALETIERNAKSQSQIIDDILDISRIVRGTIRLNMRPVNLVSIIETAIEAVLPAVEAKAIRLDRVLPASVGLISGDSERLQQVIWNLLSNGIKFTPEKGRVEIELSSENLGGWPYAQIKVSDTGKGISADFLPYVFERFRQANSTTTRTHGGLGLGLAIVRHLVELHGGTVRAESPGEGCGATFIVNLPLLAVPPVSSTPELPTIEEIGSRVALEGL